MKKIFLIKALLLFSVLHCIAAGDNNAQWKKGNDLYLQKQYDSAAYYYEQIAAIKPQNANVYFNLGNTYYRLNKIGPAVLNYERALRINPDYAEAKDNLALAQSRISNRILYAGDIFFVTWWQSLTRPDRSTGWAVAALVTFLLIIVLLLLRHFQKTSGKRIPVQLPGVLGFVCACFLLLAYAAAENMVQHTGAVVMQADAPLMNNEQRGKPIALIPEGTSVKIKAEKGAWVEVSLPDGRTGWLDQSVITKI